MPNALAYFLSLSVINRKKHFKLLTAVVNVKGCFTPKHSSLLSFLSNALAYLSPNLKKTFNGLDTLTVCSEFYGGSWAVGQRSRRCQHRRRKTRSRRRCRRRPPSAGRRTWRKRAWCSWVNVINFFISFVNWWSFQVLHSRIGSWPYPQTLD